MTSRREREASRNRIERKVELRAEMKKLQGEQFNLITSNHNPARFGEVERRLTAIFTELNELER